MTEVSTAVRCCRDCNAELAIKPGGGKPLYCPDCRIERTRASSRDAQRRRKAGVVLQPERYPCSECAGEVVWELRGRRPERCPRCRETHQRKYLKNWQSAKGHLSAGSILACKCKGCGTEFDWVVTVGRRPWKCQACVVGNRRAASSFRYREMVAKLPAPPLNRTCVDCGGTYYRKSTRGGPTFRCAPCQKIHGQSLYRVYAAQRLERLREVSRLAYETDGRWSKCGGCGVKLSCARMGLSRKWCETCLPDRRKEVLAEWKVANPEAWRNIVYRANQARRARLAAVEKVPYKRSDILKRDKWTCQLCKARISKRFKGRHRLAPSIDHQIPIIDGGADSPANVVAAHVGCNSKKRDGFVRGGEQLQLIG